VAVPTDTVYGYAAAFDKPVAIERLYTIKGRPAQKPIPVLLSDFDKVHLVAQDVNELARSLANWYWPGPLTIVVRAISGLHARLVGEDGSGTPTVAVRIPNHGLAREIIAAAGGALAVTSANRSGDHPARDAQAIPTDGDGAPDVIVAGGPAAIGRASTIVLATERQPIVLREAAITQADLDRRLSVAGRRHQGESAQVGPQGMIQR
jgi:L-threonylcarbamoyladenylate synthase